MKILLIDADSKIPNLALMKISSYYKSLNSKVDLLKLDIEYFPRFKNKIQNIDTSNYDKIFCSCVFEGSDKFISGNNIEFGGSGVDIKKKLPIEIDNLDPDYSIYPENDFSYGFISRGCIRNCYFCKVREKEGYLKQVNEIKNIIKHEKVRFMDNNFLALPNHIELLKELVTLYVKCEFNQGLDIRLINDENSMLLSKLNYMGEYIFAFDDIKLLPLIKQKLSILKWAKEWKLKFFIYIHPDMKNRDITKRIKFLKSNKILPYIMRDISCFSSVDKDFYTDLASWGNQPNLFKKMDFEDFMIKRTKNKNRIEKSIKMWREK